MKCPFKKPISYNVTHVTGIYELTLPCICIVLMGDVIITPDFPCYENNVRTPTLHHSIPIGWSSDIVNSQYVQEEAFFQNMSSILNEEWKNKIPHLKAKPEALPTIVMPTHVKVTSGIAYTLTIVVVGIIIFIIVAFLSIPSWKVSILMALSSHIDGANGNIISDEIGEIFDFSISMTKLAFMLVLFGLLIYVIKLLRKILAKQKDGLAPSSIKIIPRKEKPTSSKTPNRPFDIKTESALLTEIKDKIAIREKAKAKSSSHKKHAHSSKSRIGETRMYLLASPCTV